MAKSRFLRGYNKRLFLYYFLIFVIFTVVVTLFLYQREKKHKIEQLDNLLDNYCLIIENRLNIVNDSIEDLGDLLNLFPDTTLRFTVISKKGVVLYDSFIEDYQHMENHATREEVLQAKSEQTGRSIRFSSTARIEYFYHARNFPNVIVRAALPYNVSTIRLLRVDNLYIYFMFLVFIIGVGIIIVVSERFGHSVQQLELFARRAGNNEEIDVNIEFPANELGGIGEQIVQIYSSLKQAQHELSYEREKLFKHLHISREGLAIFSQDKKEILANNYFIHYANLISDDQLIWSDEIFNIKEFDRINDFIKENMNALFHNEFGVMQEQVKISKNNYTFIVDCIIFSDKTFEISINDVTEKEERDQLKRELTSNISHELKTPVSSIQGYLETLVNNKNLPEDKRQFFLERSHIQSIRLSNLVKDISVINKIDEANAFYDKEDVNVQQIAENALADVHLLLEDKNIMATAHFDFPVHIAGNTSLIYSVFRNLVDNTVAYAGEDIQVGIECYKEDDKFYYFRYYDTGKGVSQEHLNRIFERFYRVDSGRARKYGGTGLGLSIVKNAVVMHGGQISVKNRVGGGLEFLFTLHKPAH